MASDQDQAQSMNQANSPFRPLPYLPIEIRWKIWTATWEPRVIEPLRKLVDHVCDDPRPPRTRASPPPPGNTAEYLDWLDDWTEECCQDKRESHRDALLSDWDNSTFGGRFRQLTGLPPGEHTEAREQFHTITWSKAKLPIALWINQESRNHTLKSYKLCWGLEGGESRIYFNFDLDALYLPCNSAWLQYHKKDLDILQTAVCAGPLYPSLCGWQGQSMMQEILVSLKGPCAFQSPPLDDQYLPGEKWLMNDALKQFTILHGITKTFPALENIVVLCNFYDRDFETRARIDSLDPPHVIGLLSVRYDTENKVIHMQQSPKEEAAVITQLCISGLGSGAKGCLPTEILLERAGQDAENCDETSQEALTPPAFGQRMEDYVDQFEDAAEGEVHWISWKWIEFLDDIYGHPLDPDVEDKALIDLDVEEHYFR